MKVCVAVVRVLIAVDDADEACDCISALLTENMQKYAPESSLLDWQYEDVPKSPTLACLPTLVDIDDDFKPDFSEIPGYPALMELGGGSDV